MTMKRRDFVISGLGSISALALPAGSNAAALLAGFTHGVASGEPGARSVLLWTRYVAPHDVTLRCEVSATADFRRVISGGTALASADRDHTARLTVTGLLPDRWYHYRFIAPDGTVSLIGRTRTLPEGDTARFGLGVFCCSSIAVGWFNAYGHAARRNDLDLMVHVGDYIYEYGLSSDPQGRRTQPARNIDPSDETITLADYRLRYALYRRDPDLLALHARYPMVAQWDDHELANDAWRDGAQNHDDSKGPWPVRRDAAIRAYREWLPVSDDTWRSYQIGSLATLFKLETRVTGRVEQLDLGDYLGEGHDVEAALRQFRDGPWTDPARTMLGAQQERWLADALRQSTRSRTRWQVVSQQTVMGHWRMAPEVTDWAGTDRNSAQYIRAQRNVIASSLGLPWSMDSWSGYPAARDRLLRDALQAEANLLVLSGDSHNAWGQNLVVDGAAAGAEFAGQAVTSGGMDGMFPRTAPADVAAALQRANPGLLLSETGRRGYMSVQLTPQQAHCDWHFFDTVRQPRLQPQETRRLRVLPGRRVLQSAV